MNRLFRKQVELCGVSGRQIQIPLRFTSLDDSAEAQYGTMGENTA